MATYREYFEDFQADTLLYREKLVITPRQYMRWVVDGMQRAQRRTNVQTGTKVMPEVSGAYDIGDDVLEIVTLVGPDNREILLSSITQNQMILDQEPIGLNETPYNFSLKRDNSFVDNWGYEAKIGVVSADGLLRVFPDPGGSVTMSYIVDIHRFSQSSSQWSSWFASEQAFDDNFSTTQPNVQITQFDEAFQSYALMKYFAAIHNQDGVVIYAQMWRDALATILSNKQQMYTNGVAAYNFGPIQ